MRTSPFAVLLLFILPEISCTDISPTDTLSWQVNYVLPVLKERISVAMLGLKGQKIHDDTTHFGDTLYINRNDTLKREYRSTIFSLPQPDEKTWYTGLSILTRLNKIESIMPLSIISEDRSVHKKIKCPSSDIPTVITWKDTLTIGSVKSIEFGHSDRLISAIVKNTSTGAVIRNVSYSIISLLDTILFSVIPSLTPGDSVKVYATLNNKTIGSCIIVQCQTEITAPITHGDSSLLYFRTDFNNLSFSRGTLSDSLVAFDFSCEFTLPFGQKGFNAKFIDVNDFSFPFSIQNTLPVGIQLDAVIGNVWSREYCISEGITSSEYLDSHNLDSSYFQGDELITLTIPPHYDSCPVIPENYCISFDNARFLPAWNDQDTINMLDVSFHGKIEARGAQISIDNMCHAGIRVGMPQVDINSIYGCYTIEKRIVNQPVVLPILTGTATADLVKKIRKKLIPEKTDIALKIQFNLPDKTTFESVDLLCSLFETDSQKIIDNLLFQIDDIRAGKVFTYNDGFGNILKSIPDSLEYLLTYIMKPGKTIFLDKDVLHYENGHLEARFDAEIALDMSMYLVWGVVDTITFEFTKNTGTFPLSSKSIGLMKQKELTLSALLTNQSNIIGRLRAVTEDITFTNKIPKMVTTPLLGTNGLLFPLRGTSIENVFSLNQTDIRNITSPESLSIHWILDLFPCPPDALHDTDYIEIDAEMTLKGEHSTESIISH